MGESKAGWNLGTSDVLDSTLQTINCQQHGHWPFLCIFLDFWPIGNIRALESFDARCPAQVPQPAHVQLTPVEFYELELTYPHQVIKSQNLSDGRGLSAHPRQPPIKALPAPGHSGFLSFQIRCPANAGEFTTSAVTRRVSTQHGCQALQSGLGYISEPDRSGCLLWGSQQSSSGGDPLDSKIKSVHITYKKIQDKTWGYSAKITANGHHKCPRHKR